MSAYEFFYKHAGTSYTPGKETKEQGRVRGSRLLAKVERQASNGGFSFDWSIDPHSTSADWIDDNEDGGRDHEPWATWQCVMRNTEGEIVNSLHGIDFGRDGQPWGNHYRRVVEAELAVDGLTNEPQ